MSSNTLEIELKFTLLPSETERLIDTLSVLTQSPSTSKLLSNTYYETADQLLRKNDMGLRVRGCDGYYEMTLKTRGLGPSGLLKRAEYNYPLLSSELNLLLLPNNVWSDSQSWEELQNKLQPQFTTDFQRTEWHIRVPVKDTHTLVEVVLDRGKIYSVPYFESILEVELELKSGPVEGLFILSRQLIELNRLRLSDMTKAARGYRLYHLSQSSVDPQMTSQAGALLKSPSLEHEALKNDLNARLALLFYLEESLSRNLLDFETIQQNINLLLNTITPEEKGAFTPLLLALDHQSLHSSLYSFEYNQQKLNWLETLSNK